VTGAASERGGDCLRGPVAGAASERGGDCLHAPVVGMRGGSPALARGGGRGGGARAREREERHADLVDDLGLVVGVAQGEDLLLEGGHAAADLFHGLGAHAHHERRDVALVGGEVLHGLGREHEHLVVEARDDLRVGLGPCRPARVAALEPAVGHAAHQAQIEQHLEAVRGAPRADVRHQLARDPLWIFGEVGARDELANGGEVPVRQVLEELALDAAGFAIVPRGGDAREVLLLDLVELGLAVRDEVGEEGRFLDVELERPRERRDALGSQVARALDDELEEVGARVPCPAGEISIREGRPPSFFCDVIVAEVAPVIGVLVNARPMRLA